MTKTMMLIKTNWANKATFRMISVDNNAPYNECIFDVDQKVLAIITKEKKESFQMIPKLTPTGDIEVLKIGKRPNGKDYSEERRTMQTYYEYYVTDESDIINIVNLLSINADSFDFQTIIKSVAQESLITPVASPIITV